MRLGREGTVEGWLLSLVSLGEVRGNSQIRKECCVRLF